MQSYNYQLLKEYSVTWTVVYLELEVGPVPKSSYVWTSDIMDKAQQIPTVPVNPPFQYYFQKTKLNNFIVIINKQDE
jgi:hypothetical protein